METPRRRYAQSADGTFIAYQVFGEDPDLLIASAWISHLEMMWEFAELILQPEDEGLPAAEWIASQVPGATVVRLPESPDYPPELSDPERNLEATRAFIADLRDQEAELDRVQATVLFTDIVDSTATAAALGDRAWRDLVERHHAIVRGFLSRYRGKEIDTAGDGFFATFDGLARPSAALSTSSKPSAPSASRSAVIGARVGSRAEAGGHPRIPDRQGSDGRQRPRLRRCRRTRTEGCARALAPLTGDRMIGHRGDRPVSLLAT